MKYAILGDIHGNLEALHAVLEDAQSEGVDEYICLGDVVGYGADPSACLQKIREIAKFTVAGNHDFAAVGKLNIEFFNAFARESALWTRNQLSDEEKEWLSNLKLVEYLEDFTVVHATVHSPELFEYIQTSYDAHLSFEELTTPLAFVGHSHVPVTFVQKKSVSFTLDPEIKLDGDHKTIINVGSVGQPRDENPDAAYAIYDTGERLVRIKRIEYDIAGAAHKIIEAGLPEILAERLHYGR
jgi:predicted phosphodiesterase